MAIYPFYEDLQKHSKNMHEGNYGLWYNKLIPIADANSNKSSFKACDLKGSADNAVQYYVEQYRHNAAKAKIQPLLDKKQRDYEFFCDALSSRYEMVLIKAKLIAPLITGIGESHPHEVSMVFDHNMGIPYIPASGIKGIVRFAHTLSLLDDPRIEIKEDNDGGLFFDDEEDWTYIPKLFGSQKKKREQRGSVIFLDAYPEKVPQLHVDIMNPHYAEYYSEGKPPADYLNPIPIKFLTVAKNTIFIFRALVDKEITNLKSKVEDAFLKALTVEGVGAKTAVGYGLFAVEGIKTNVESSKLLLETDSPKKTETPAIEVWKNVYLKYLPNTGEIKTSFQGKNAFTKEKNLIPDSMVKKLIKQRKGVTADIKTELIGGKEYRITEISK